MMKKARKKDEIKIWRQFLVIIRRRLNDRREAKDDEHRNLRLPFQKKTNTPRYLYCIILCKIFYTAEYLIGQFKNVVDQQTLYAVQGWCNNYFLQTPCFDEQFLVRIHGSQPLHWKTFSGGSHYHPCESPDLPLQPLLGSSLLIRAQLLCWGGLRVIFNTYGTVESISGGDSTFYY
jgi:hypothetical protein